ncbi:LIM domain protein [Dictyocaulus viviparus]|uniref:LIM domain protein n=1 Tax=Dictyocaulus viviparus TaxID=29172 RepID=A0A0D8XHG3_DICVI|nr:LIM domain protein [Dictyocaulus viviparus]
MTTVSPVSTHSYHWRGDSRQVQHPETQVRSESRGSTAPDPVERHVARWRSESRNSNRAFRNDEEPSQQDEIVSGTLSALRNDVEQTTEVIRKRQHQMRIERRQFQTEMEVTGRVSISPTDEWLSSRLRTVSTEDMTRELGKIKEDQRQNAVTDTLAALVYDVNATAEVLRRGSMKRGKDGRGSTHKEEIEYRLRLTPAPEEERPFPSPKPRQVSEERFTVDEVSRDYGMALSESRTSSLRRKRARSETPRRTLHIEGSPPPSAPVVCAYCSEEIDGPILTALAPNSERAQKFHTYHFMCCYCQKALNMHGTFREHDRKPYCHDCFYRLYNGLLYKPDEHQKMIEKLI